MGTRRFAAALTVAFALATAPAGAQINQSFLVGPVDPAPIAEPARPNLPVFRIMDNPEQPGRPPRNGLIAAYPVRENLTIGVGRFAIPEIARPRTHMEADSQPTAVRRRERGLAAVGFSFRF